MLCPVLLRAATVSCLLFACVQFWACGISVRKSPLIPLSAPCRHEAGLSVTASNLKEIEDPGTNIMCALFARCALEFVR